MKILLASGDSHTTGSYPNSPIPLNGDNVWAKHISDKLNLKYLNVARPGAGTEEISLNTIMCAHNLVKKYKENPQDIFVVVLWAVNNNKYMYWTGSEHKSYGIGSTMETPEDAKKFVEYKTKLDSDNYDSYRDYQVIYNTAIALERFEIPYLFCNTSALIKPTNPKLLQLWSLVNTLYGDRADRHVGLHNTDESFDTYLKSRAEPIAYGVNNHAYWGTDAHKLYAEFLLEKIKC